jgi:hypothetical protein
MLADDVRVSRDDRSMTSWAEIVAAKRREELLEDVHPPTEEQLANRMLESSLALSDALEALGRSPGPALEQ